MTKYSRLLNIGAMASVIGRLKTYHAWGPMWIIYAKIRRSKSTHQPNPDSLMVGQPRSNVFRTVDFHICSCRYRSALERRQRMDCFAGRPMRVCCIRPEANSFAQIRTRSCFLMTSMVFKLKRIRLLVRIGYSLYCQLKFIA